MQVHEIGFREANTQKFLPSGGCRKGAPGDLLKGYFANLEQAGRAMRTACSVRSASYDQIT
jgi:hypothetical protein